MRVAEAARANATCGMARNPTRLALVAAVSGLLLAGCGGSGAGSGEATTTEADVFARVVKAGLAPPPGCYLTVYMADGATARQTARVQRLMVTSKRVEEVSYVPKQLAFKRFAKARPVIASRMRRNLFPDSFEVVPRTRLDVYGIILDFAAGVPGVVNVRASAPCGHV